MNEIFRFDIESVPFTEPGPHPTVRGAIYGDDLTEAQEATVRATLRSAGLQIQEDLTATVEVVKE